MPGAPGDPVRFANPFRRITSVGWPSPYLAIRMTIGSEEATSAATSCSPAVGTDNGNAANYLTEASMLFGVGAIMRLTSNGEWATVGEATVENNPEQTFENTFTPETVAATYVSGPYRFSELGAASAIADVPVPAHPGANFAQTVNLSFEVIGRMLDASGGVCNAIPFSGNFLQFPYASEIGPVTSPEPIAINAMVVHYRDKAYTPIGCYLVPNVKGANPSIHISAPVEAWVLCERAQA